MVSGMLHRSPTDLQIYLGVAMRRNKCLTTLLHKFGVCCSYDEVTLFKYSAAVTVAEDLENVRFSGNNLIHCCADNFDCEISSQNSNLLCHSLAMVLAQTEDSVCSDTGAGEHKTIPRQKMEDRHKSVDYTVPEIRYDGPKKPPMPPLKALYQIPPLSFLCSQVISVHRSHDLDYQFMKDIVTRESCPEWSGYNTQLSRQTGMVIEPKAKVVYLPLIDKAPASGINNTHSNRERSNLAERCRDGTEYPSIYGRSTTVQGHSRHPVPHSIILHERNPYPWGYAYSHGFHSCHLHHPLSRI